MNRIKLPVSRPVHSVARRGRRPARHRALPGRRAQRVMGPMVFKRPARNHLRLPRGRRVEGHVLLREGRCDSREGLLAKATPKTQPTRLGELRGCSPQRLHRLRRLLGLSGIIRLVASRRRLRERFQGSQRQPFLFRWRWPIRWRSVRWWLRRCARRRFRRRPKLALTPVFALGQAEQPCLARCSR